MTCLLLLRKASCEKGLLVLEHVGDYDVKTYTVTNQKLCPHKLYEVECASLEEAETAVKEYE